MSTYYYAINAVGDYIFDNFPEDGKHLVAGFVHTKEPIKLTIGGEDHFARLGRKSNAYGTLYVLTTDAKFINRYKYFQELIDLSLIALGPMVNFQLDLIKGHSAQNEEFIHNVTSLNSYSIQDLFSLVPQRTLTENINKQSEIVKAIIADQPNVTVKTILNLIKYSLATKVEFSVFERTLKASASVQLTEHSIRSVLLSILQIFIDDFEKKKIEVSLASCDKILSIDYDSIFVSFYYLLENSLKYCCRDTKFKIQFKEESDGFSILFIMISIKIDDAELSKLTVKGYRSALAKKVHSSGHGIGMYRILKTLKLNNAEIEITPRVNEYSRTLKEIRYEANQFKVKFRGQQDWFKTLK
jgi:hypothetical protein